MYLLFIFIKSFRNNQIYSVIKRNSNFSRLHPVISATCPHIMICCVILRADECFLQYQVLQGTDSCHLEPSAAICIAVFLNEILILISSDKTRTNHWYVTFGNSALRPTVLYLVLMHMSFILSFTFWNVRTLVTEQSTKEQAYWRNW